MTEKQYKNDIIKKMKSIGSYNDAFLHVVNILAKSLKDFEDAQEQFEESGRELVIEYTNKNGSTNTVKNPVYLSIEKLRNDILVYSRELGLTPAGLKRINDLAMGAPKRSKLEEVLLELSKS